MSKKLVIRINNLQDIEKNDAYEVIEETAIRWDRVIGVIVFALLLVIAAIVGLVTVFNSDTTDSFESNIELVSVDRSHPEPESSVSDTDIVTPEKQAIPEKQMMPEQEVVVQNLPTQEDQLIVKETPEKTTVVDDMPVERAAPKLAHSDPINIQSEKIVRAQLTNAVSKKEPVDKLGSAIPMNEKGLIKVFLFTDMQGLKGETLYHEWYLAGKRMARVKINVRNNNVSASSSKFIDKYMMGDWKVNVVNHSGDALVSAQFVVSP